MFTGIVEEIGRLRQIHRGVHSAVLTIGGRVVLENLHLGDSIAVNGVCLTVTSFDTTGFTADVMHETLNRSALGGIKVGAAVNLERAMAADGRFGGHIVSGHIDGTGCIIGMTRDDTAVWYTIETAPQILRYIVEKGSITIDGISLTVAGTEKNSFSISAIPHTVKVTTLGQRRVGDRVNLETDIIGKYVEKLMTAREGPKKPGLSREDLIRFGY